ncbi:MAG: phosphoribosyltransferase [Candidatus Thermoplasmatota archaeon]|nr:phosphoribosyltransferase [Candidatus Thermoplasmatota archaeon]
MDFKARFVSWQEIDKWCDEIYLKLVADSFKPEAIIGLARGGLVPSRILSDSLFVKDLYAVKTEHWGITATRNGTATIQKTTDLNVKGRKVLVVDDIIDTGGSMKLARDFISTLGPSALRTATMLHIDHSSFAPDFYAEKVTKENWTWFIFPWNVHEDIYNLSSKFLDQSMSTGEISKELQSRFGLNVGDVNMERVLDQIHRIGKLQKNGKKWSRINS